MKILRLLTLVGALSLSFSVMAEENFSLIDYFKTNGQKVICSKNWELYVPVRTWHNRAAYDREHIDGYQERPWGAGLGKYYIDNKGNQHSLYFMAFKDSHNDWEPTAGYAWQKNFYPLPTRDFRLGLGYTIFLTMRSDYNYIPIPAPLPLAAIEYKNFAIQGTYLPGFSDNSGNIAFIWCKWKF